MKEKILDAKCKLFLLLNQLNEDQITDNETEILFLLSKDKQIQELLDKNK